VYCALAEATGRQLFRTAARQDRDGMSAPIKVPRMPGAAGRPFI